MKPKRNGKGDSTDAAPSRLETKRDIVSITIYPQASRIIQGTLLTIHGTLLTPIWVIPGTLLTNLIVKF
jgi:hypothetical protein